MNIKIESLEIGGEKTIVIAEAGVNHLGRMDYAEELVKTAARAGADVVKFQTYKADKLSTKKAPRFWSWEGEHDQEGSQHDSYSNLDSFGKSEYIELKKICDKYGVVFMSTPFDEESADMLVEIGMKGFKIASCDLTNLPFLKHIAKNQLPILLSTGAATIEEIRQAVDVIEGQGNQQICIMQCTLCYPTKPKDSNLSALNDIAEHFPGYVLGLSDHTLGTIVPSASILYGAKVIEKHYTFDKTLPDSADHWLSLDESEMKLMVDNLRELEVAIGGGKKVKLECETPAHKFARRSLVSEVGIKKGEVITRDMLAIKRPGTGLAPEFLDRFVGQVAAKDIEADVLLTMADIVEA
ncbi:MAG: N-acetylneuraminate synthase family protein [Arenicella sp.]